MKIKEYNKETNKRTFMQEKIKNKQIWMEVKKAKINKNSIETIKGLVIYFEINKREVWI